MWDILVGGATVAIVALTDDEQVVLARQYRPGPGRVLLEEAGYEAATLEVVMRTFLASYASHRRHAVLARGCRKVAEPRLDDGEFIETVLMPIGAFVQHVLSGQMTDTDLAFAGLVAAGYLKP
ncbi:NUDIX hydrolase [Nonomuraea sp. NPDC050227]|uniref:NUDIX hydrolase n=1 Tax=Nonomuraea sp. NPDC050227 TaxID=3364360 RepID=UPI003790F14A